MVENETINLDFKNKLDKFLNILSSMVQCNIRVNILRPDEVIILMDNGIFNQMFTIWQIDDKYYYKEGRLQQYAEKTIN